MIDLYCAGSCRDNGKPSQIAGCAVIATINDSGQTKFREYGYALGNINNYSADIQSVRLGLMSINSKFRNSPIIIHSINKYIIMVLTNTEIEVVKNQEAIMDIRKLYKAYNNIKVILEDPKNNNMIRTRDLARQAMASQIHFDTGTLNGTKGIN